jgi:hypothetical protein
MKSIYFALLTAVIFACQKPEEKQIQKEENPHSDGFNLESSDKQAIDIADQVMVAMGGRSSWDNTRLIQWNFFGARKLLWDKESGWVRIEDQRNDLKINVNIMEETLIGMVQKEGKTLKNTDSIQKYLDQGKRIWINDSYWLVMPFKLKDSGVTLTYQGKDTTSGGLPSKKLRMTFENVGVTPQNAYDVWVGVQDSLIRQWAYYANASDSIPRFVLPWNDYREYGMIKLSGSRGERSLSEIKVLDQVEESFFTSFDRSL